MVFIKNTNMGPCRGLDRMKVLGSHLGFQLYRYRQLKVVGMLFLIFCATNAIFILFFSLKRLVFLHSKVLSSLQSDFYSSLGKYPVYCAVYQWEG